LTTYVRVSRRPGAQFFRFSAIGGVFAYRGVMTYYGTVMTAKLTVSFDEFEQAMSDRPNPDQAQWYGEVVAPMLDGEAAWIDGHWKDNE
jgi:hypothetical protein